VFRPSRTLLHRHDHRRYRWIGRGDDQRVAGSDGLWSHGLGHCATGALQSFRDRLRCARHDVGRLVHQFLVSAHGMFLQDFRLFDLRFFGTLLPARRASERPIAIACPRLLTFLPLRPERSVPDLRSFIAFFTFFAAPFEYFRLRPFFAIAASLGLIKPRSGGSTLRPCSFAVADRADMRLFVVDLCELDAWTSQTTFNLRVAA
jgi:hypothetical protein